MSVRRITLDRGDARIAVRDGGGERAPIVLAHGLGGSAIAFKRVAPLLGDRFRVITYDLRGHGASSPSSDYSWAAQTGDLRAVLDELELERPVLAGHSLGAGLALAVAASFPGCAGFAALDGALPAELPAPDWTQLERAARVGASLSIPEMQAIAQDYWSRWEEFEVALQRLACPAVYVLARRQAPGPDGAAALEAVHAGAERIAELAAGIEVRWLDTGHAMTRTRPREVAEALRALSGGPTPAATSPCTPRPS
jgi:esterase